MMRYLLVLIVVANLAACRTISISTESMEDVLIEGGYYAVELGNVIGRDDLVVFTHVIPEGEEVWCPLRVAGMPGDKFRLRSAEVIVNDVKQEQPATVQFMYVVDGDAKIEATLVEQYAWRNAQQQYSPGPPYFVNLTLTEAEELRGVSGVFEVTSAVVEFGMPSDFHREEIIGARQGWQLDNFGPLKIPKKGESITINADFYALYEIVLTDEAPDHTMPVQDEVIEHIVQQDWYFMLGENRHNVYDSRYIGFVPKSHIVGIVIQ